MEKQYVEVENGLAEGGAVKPGKVAAGLVQAGVDVQNETEVMGLLVNVLLIFSNVLSIYCLKSRQFYWAI